MIMALRPVVLGVIGLAATLASVASACGTDTDIPSTTTVVSATIARDYIDGTTSTNRVFDDHGGATPERVFSVAVADGTVVGGVPRFEVSVGDLVRVTVTSDVDDEVHLHVYNLVVTVDVGVPALLDLEATVPGVFEAELHHAGFRVFELQVS